MKGRHLALSTLLGLVAVACSSSEPSSSNSATASAAAAAPAMAPEVELDALLRGIADCKVGDAKCNGAAALVQWAGVHKAWLDEEHRAEAAAVGARHVKGPAPIVRIEAWNLVARRVKDDPSMQALVVDGAKTEKDPQVLVAIAAAASRAPEAPEVRAELVGLLAHADETVRKRATEALVPTNGPPDPSVRPSVLSAMKGASIDVRRKICQRLRVGDDPDLLAAVARVLDTPNVPPELHDDCLYGLMLSWMGPSVGAPSKAAYERSMTCIEKCKREDKHIGLGVSLLRAVIAPKPEDKKPAPFVDVARVEKAVVAIIQDEKAQPSLRFSAAMDFDDVDVASKKSGVPSKTLLELGAKMADPAAR